MIDVLAIFLLCLTVITAVGAVMARNLFAATMLMGIFSLLMAVAFLLLDAADVALTEAAVGAGISTVLLLAALSLTGHEQDTSSMRPGLALIVVAVTAAVILYATFDKPALGDPNAPVNTHVAAAYFSMTRENVDIPNVVTGVLSTFRGYDTLGEVIVVLTAAIGVLFLLGPGSPKPERNATQARSVKPGLKHHQPLRIVGKITIPFIVLFALYVQFHGEYSPGGGFQAGALLAAAIILYGLLEGRDAANTVIPPSVMRMMAACGGLIFGGVGVTTMLLGGNFLDYDVLLDNTVKAQQVGIIIIEAGVGLAVAGVLMVIYHTFSARSRA